MIIPRLVVELFAPIEASVVILMGDVEAVTATVLVFNALGVEFREVNETAVVVVRRLDVVPAEAFLAKVVSAVDKLSVACPVEARVSIDVVVLLVTVDVTESDDKVVTCGVVVVEELQNIHRMSSQE